MSEASRVERVVRSAWERRLLVVAVERSAIAVALVLAAVAAMLLVGTQVLDWRWLLLLAGVGLGVAGYQVRQRSLEHYRVAQLLDRRLNLADSISTAWYLASGAAKRRDSFTDYQLRSAEETARRVDLPATFPFTGGKPWLVAGCLALFAASLFSVRYLVTNSLSIRRPLIPLTLAEAMESAGAGSKETEKERQEERGSDQRGERKTPKADGQKDDKEPPRTEPPPLAAGNSPSAGQNPNERAEMRESKEGQDNQSQERSEGKAGSAQRKAGDNSDEDADKSGGSPKPSSDDKANAPQTSDGLINRMKDALSSLAAKMKPNNQGKRDSNKEPGEDKKSGQQGASKEQNGAAKQDGSKRGAAEQQASDGQGQGQTQEKAKPGEGKASDQAGDKSKSDSHSGIGSQDGDKETKDAEQLKAMGKLAEIIGKRSATATGDVMVENPSGKQQLQTDYSKRAGKHADLGGEINRDEIPLMYQQYIREYMSQVRRQTKRHKR